jgi:hypothetical protein
MLFGEYIVLLSNIDHNRGLIRNGTLPHVELIELRGEFGLSGKK